MQKRQILTRLSTRADKSGVLRVVSQRFRTQKANRNAALERLVELLADALRVRPVRKETRVPQRAHRKRLEDKRRRSRLKQLRSDKDFEL
jgi:ribosome-associated protein